MEYPFFSSNPPSKKPKTSKIRKSKIKTSCVDVVAEEENEKEQEQEQEEEKERPSPFERVFSKEDEITLLKGLSAYVAENGTEIGFHQHINMSLSTQVTKFQLQEKIKRMKRKFKRNETNGFSKKLAHHDKQVLDLSKNIWGAPEEVKQHSSLSPCVSVDEVFGFNLVGGGKTEMDKKLVIKFKIAELKLLQRENELKNEKMQLLIECLESDNEA